MLFSHVKISYSRAEAVLFLNSLIIPKENTFEINVL